jgi:circadian clock protein KaiC
LDYKSSIEIISTGLASLDKLFSKGGVFRGSSTLVTGTAGTSKTILAGYFALSSCLRKEPVLYFSFEESADQMIRNMGSVGIPLKSHIKSGLLLIHASRPSLQGLEMHLLLLHKIIREFKHRTVIIDPISSLITIGTGSEVRAMLVRLMDLLKVNHINAFFTALAHRKETGEEDGVDTTVDAVSSLADTWINLKNEGIGGLRHRSLLIVKSRGMAHSNDPNNFVITNKGIKLILSKD